MKIEDILSIKDWIKISIKFAGTCSSCNRRIDSRNYGYWSKSSKAVLHESCYVSLFLSSSDIQNSNGTDGNDNFDHLANTINIRGKRKGFADKKMAKKKCFICDRPVDVDNNLITCLLKLNEINDNSKSDIVYCYDCLENFDDKVFKQYQNKFIKEIG